jgi:hypothetical protein
METVGTPRPEPATTVSALGTTLTTSVDSLPNDARALLDTALGINGDDIDLDDSAMHRPYTIALDASLTWYVKIAHRAAFFIQMCTLVATAAVYADASCRWPIQISANGCQLGNVDTWSINLCAFLVVALVASVLSELVQSFSDVSAATETRVRWTEAYITSSCVILITAVVAGTAELPDILRLMLIEILSTYVAADTDAAFSKPVPASSLAAVIASAPRRVWLRFALAACCWIPITLQLLYTTTRSEQRTLSSTEAVVITVVLLRLVHILFKAAYVAAKISSTTERIAHVVLSTAVLQTIAICNYANVLGLS